MTRRKQRQSSGSHAVCLLVEHSGRWLLHFAVKRFTLADSCTAPMCRDAGLVTLDWVKLALGDAPFGGSLTALQVEPLTALNMEGEDVEDGTVPSR